MSRFNNLTNNIIALLNPLQNGAMMILNWIQTRPTVTQQFGINPQIYEAFGLDGHNGIDFRAPIGTKVYAPMDGVIKVKDSGTQGYGLHVKLRNDFKASETVLGHFSAINLVDNQRVNMGDLIGWSGNSGFSTGPHLHIGYRLLKDGGKDIFEWQVMDYNNGYKGYIDCLEYFVTWKGSLLQNSI